MIFFRKAVLLGLSIGLSLVFLTQPVMANDTEFHFTVIMNQVRGSECCDAGKLENFESQLATLQELNLPASFAVRYDVLSDAHYQQLINSHPTHEYGALLEVTPKLAQDAGVEYRGSDKNWYQAHHVFLVGYTQADRKKLLDQYFKTYQDTLGRLPGFSTAWMIDAWSLKYLRETYGVKVHQVTREQFGTDSYTLYGGPAHYPYYASDSWALIPEPTNTTGTLILRQTITDPVLNYGDKTNSYTSQPNDYFLRGATLTYFEHLFWQAHDQPNDYTFALVGLENSMAELAQAEFKRQLKAIREWQVESAVNKVLTPAGFATWFQAQAPQDFQVYGGVAATSDKDQAWWIDTATYRARLRWSEGELALTDLRVYDSAFSDPYTEATSSALGRWIVPFVLDGSRFFGPGEQARIVKTDSLKNRSHPSDQPIRLAIAKDIRNLDVRTTAIGLEFYQDSQTLAIFTATNFTFPATQTFAPTAALPATLRDWSWFDEQGRTLWGFKVTGQTWTPFVTETNLDQVRSEAATWLFPQTQPGKLDPTKTWLHVNNAYAVAGRNPARLVLFPENKDGEGVLLGSYPEVSTTNPVGNVTIFEPHSNNGMVFIDVVNAHPLKTEVTVKKDGFEKKLNLHFAPNCRDQKLYCLTHPRQAWWFVRSYLGDKWRALQEKFSNSDH